MQLPAPEGLQGKERGLLEIKQKYLSIFFSNGAELKAGQGR